MLKHIKTLMAVLFAQIALVTILLVDNDPLSAKQTPSKLVSFKTDQVDKLVIESDDGETSVKIVKQGENWQLPDLDNFKANASKVAAVVSDLAKLESSWVVSSDKDAAERFKAKDDAFEKRATLYDGDQVVAKVTLGTSPGYRRVYGRIGDEPQIHDLSFNTYQLDDDVQSWTDKTVLHLNTDDVKEIRFEGLNLVNKDGKWSLADLKEGETVDFKKTKELADRVLKLGFNKVNRKTEPLKDAKTITVIKSDGTELVYRIAKVGDEDKYMLKTSGGSSGYELSKYNFDQLIPKERKSYLTS